ncbi:DnaJ protein ERDJ2A [Porphyridium purpureum]|uniref:DnaJ protein ERDJ2A n=1 Tax=Porphyridium purpureum TaxID=35688 RepID=A0A5J4Z955_PORPP|nr:DnaJ protein ERDJ2A [Porphyridium purpureum]|eukprot:POR8205..scf295_1
MGREEGAQSAGSMLYDDIAFELFVMALLAMIVVPSLLYKLYRHVRGDSAATKIEKRRMSEFCGCERCQVKRQALLKAGKGANGSGSSAVLWNVVLLVLCGALLVLGMRVYSQRHVMEAPFDPFETLGVGSYASEQEIKAAYRKLSRIYHPDKTQGDPQMSEKFVRIAKAYQALTDEVAKENYRKYGNPDGYRGTSYGIALPHFMVENESSLLVAYFVVIVVAFPAIVGLWWRRQSKKMPNSVLMTTFRMYVFFLGNSNLVRTVMLIYALSFEFEGTFRKELRPYLAELAQKLQKRNLFDLKKVKLPFPAEDWMQQSLLVLNAHVHRVEIPSELEPVLNMLLERVPVLTQALMEAAFVPRRDSSYMLYQNTAKGMLSSYLNCLKVTQMLCQGLSDKDSPLLQIPLFTEEEVRHCGTRKKNIAQVAEFARLDADARKSILRKFSAAELAEVDEFVGRFPLISLDVSDALVDVEGDQRIHEGDTVTVKGTLSLGRSKGSVLSPCVNRIPVLKNEVWWLLLADQQRDVVVAFKKLTHADLDNENDASLTEERFSFKLQFVAPVQGKYDLTCFAVCDVYLGCMEQKLLQVQVLPQVQIDDSTKYFDTDDEDSADEAAHDDDEDDEEDEDAEGSGDENDSAVETEEDDEPSDYD